MLIKKCNYFDLNLIIVFQFIRYLFSGLLVVLGIYLNVYSKNKKAWNTFFYKNYLRLCGHKEDHISKLV